MHVKEMGPLLCSRKYGNTMTGVTSANLGWPQCLPLVGSGFEPLRREEEESGETKPRNYDNHREQKPEVSWICQGRRHTGWGWSTPSGAVPTASCGLKTAGGSHMPRCRGPSNCRGCQTVSLFVAEVCLPQQACHPSPTSCEWEQGTAQLSSFPARTRRCAVLLGAAEWAAPGKAGWAPQIPGH